MIYPYADRETTERPAGGRPDERAGHAFRRRIDCAESERPREGAGCCRGRGIPDPEEYARTRESGAS